jgi:hypothetical protein
MMNKYLLSLTLVPIFLFMAACSSGGNDPASTPTDRGGNPTANETPARGAAGTGNETIPLLYDRAENFSEGLAAVLRDGKWGFVDRAGNTVISFIYDEAMSFSEGLAAVSLDREWSFIDANGNAVISLPFGFEVWGSFQEGFAGVWRGESYHDPFCFIDREGNQITVPLASFRYGFSGGAARVSGTAGDAVINTAGELIVPFGRYDAIGEFIDGRARIFTVGIGAGFIDETGAELVPMGSYSDALDFSDGAAMVISGDIHNQMYGFIGRDGNMILPPSTHSLAPQKFSDDMAAVNINGKWGYIDKTGNTIIPELYDRAGPFSEGLATVVLNGEVGVIDKTGNVVVPFGKYNSIEIFSGGAALVRLDGKAGFIGQTGHEIIPPALEYDNVWFVSDGMAAVSIGGKWGFIEISP